MSSTAKLARIASGACLCVGVADFFAINLYLGPHAFAAAAPPMSKVVPLPTPSMQAVAVVGEVTSAVPVALPPMQTVAPPSPPPVSSPSSVAAAASATLDVVATFETGEATAHDEAGLRELAKTMVATPEARVVLDGHADHRGGSDLNRSLSMQRAAWARERLIALGVNGERVRLVAYGATAPRRPGNDPIALAANRRVEARIVGR